MKINQPFDNGKSESCAGKFLLAVHALKQIEEFSGIALIKAPPLSRT